jgi:hypothetical protein
VVVGRARSAHDRIVQRAVMARGNCSLTCLIVVSTAAGATAGAANG